MRKKLKSILQERVKIKKDLFSALPKIRTSEISHINPLSCDNYAELRFNYRMKRKDRKRGAE